MTNEMNEFQLDYTAEEINEKLGMVKDMTETNARLDTANEKLDELLVRTSFRIESGVYTAEEDQVGTATTNIQVEIPCTVGAKLIVFKADDATYGVISELTGTLWCVGVICQAVTTLPLGKVNNFRHWSFQVQMDDSTTSPKPLFENTLFYDGTTDGRVWFPVKAVKAGTYNWTAYYWDDPSDATA